MSNQRNKDEIDLLELFLNAVNTVRANFWLIVSFFIIGSVLGLFHFYSSKKVFENQMMVSSKILTEPYSQVLFQNVNRHLAEGNTGAIANRFGISEQAAGNILHFEIEKLSEVPMTDDEQIGRFLIAVDVTDQKLLPDLQTGIISYLENNDFVKIRVEQNKNYLTQTVAQIDAEIKDLEDFKFRIFKGDFFQSINGSIMFDPTSVNSKILELKEKKSTLENELELANSVQLIDGFAKFNRHTSPKLSVSLVAGSFVGLFFVGLLIAFKSIRKLLRMAETVKEPGQ